jgi:ubiquinone/menaquinone biosynthesis C-methylase UbiE
MRASAGAGDSRSPTASDREREQAATNRRYNRNAFLYDLYDRPMDLLGGVHRRRRRLLSHAQGRVLEVGVGTGRNLDLYPPGVELTGIDISPRMLARARRRAEKLSLHGTLSLELADAGRLPFEDDAFDTAAATCVFCSVADPVGALGELGRVVRPGGRVLLLEHVRPRGRLWGWAFDLLNPLVRRLAGPNINRRTEDNVAAAGLEITDVRRAGLWREIQARPSPAAPGRSDPETEEVP